MKKNRITALLSAAVLAVTGTLSAASSISMPASAEANSDYNYGEALQKSMFFYEVQQCGELPEWNEVTWRDDCMTNDYVEGGWFDAGDHLKFTLTNAYSAAMLGWGLYEYRDGVDAMGETEEYLNNLGFALDYLVGCDLGDEIVYMIGDGSFDHVWWGSAEVYMAKYELQTGNTVRPYYTCNNSCIEAEMAAALAVGALCFESTEPDRAAEYLDHAVSLFERADDLRAIGGDDEETSYYSISSFWDDLFFAANWMYIATEDPAYLDLATEYTSHLDTESQSSEIKYTWGHCWDDVTQGGILLYAINTGDSTWKEQFRKHLEYWTTGYGGKCVDYTPDGLAWLTNWGSLRHATTTAFLAYVAVDELFADDSTYVTKYTDFADSMMNYCFGDNANNFSYVVGMGDDYPHNYHHRTSSGVWDDKWTTIGDTSSDEYKEHAHTLYGALVGGPENSSGSYSDVINNYQCNEVAIDYNAGYTAALCAMVSKYGGTRDESFPETETPKWDEFYIEACINQSSASYVELKVQTTNHTAWPARVVKDLSYNYYMDFSELFAEGLTLDDISVNIGYQEWSDNCTISQPIQYDGDIYYVKISYSDGTKIMPTGQSEHQGEVQFRVSVSDQVGGWDSSNDYSFQNLVQQDLTKTEYITLYDGDTLIWGTEPDGTTADLTTTTPKETETTTEAPSVDPDDGDTSADEGSTTEEPITTETGSASSETEPVLDGNSDDTDTGADSQSDPSATDVAASLYGDTTLDDKIDLADVILLAQFLNDNATLSAEQIANGDCNASGTLEEADAVILMQFEIGAIPSIPFGSTTDDTAGSTTEPATQEINGTAYICGQAGLDSFWNTTDSGQSPVTISTPGTYTASYTFQQGSGSIECLILETNISLYDYSPDGASAGDYGVPEGCTLNCTIDSIEVTHFDGSTTEIAYTGPSAGAFRASDNGSSMRVNIFNTWTSPTVTDISSDISGIGGIMAGETLSVTFTIAA